MLLKLTSQNIRDDILMGVYIDRTKIKPFSPETENTQITNYSINIMIDGHMFGIWSHYKSMSISDIKSFLTMEYHTLRLKGPNMNELTCGKFGRRRLWKIDII